MKDLKKELQKLNKEFQKLTEQIKRLDDEERLLHIERFNAKEKLKGGVEREGDYATKEKLDCRLHDSRDGSDRSLVS